MAKGWSVEKTDDGWSVMEDGLCYERGLPNHEAAEHRMGQLVAEAELCDFINDKVDDLVDEIRAKYPNVKDIKQRIVENLM